MILILSNSFKFFQILWHFDNSKLANYFSKIRIFLEGGFFLKNPNHKSSFKKIQKCKKIEILLDWNSKPQKFFKKFFKKNPEMEKSKKIDPNHNWSKPQKFFKRNPKKWRILQRMIMGVHIIKFISRFTAKVEPISCSTFLWAFFVWLNGSLCLVPVFDWRRYLAIS